jgi:hypothetical protein
MQDPFRERGTSSTGLTAAVNLFWTFGTASAMIAPVLGLMWAGRPSEGPAPVGPPGSGIVLRTEVTAIGIPQALRELARHRAGPPVDRSSEELQTDLGRNGWRAPWYALTYRGHQLNCGFGEITQLRRLSKAADYLDEVHQACETGVAITWGGNLCGAVPVMR